MKKVVLITGATSGIGLSCATIFAQNGCDLILTGRREDRLKKIQSELQKNHLISVKTLCFDVCNQIEVQEAIQSLGNYKKSIDILINNAGLSMGLNPIHEGLLDDWETMIDTNIKGLLYVSKEIMPVMVDRKAGHIINLGSIAGKETYLNGNVYCATKHAVDSITKAMRVDLLPYGIKVSAIHPGAVETEFSLVRFKGDKARAKKVYEGFNPLTPDDIAETIYFIASRPDHVNINDLIIMPKAQASASQIERKL